ncbi:MAG TPA: DEAD/DEAH box helicase [Vicinamibacterales bacterium]|nr:DEAD/DEAH box helicase [Vicinamibacterales bacterium]
MPFASLGLSPSLSNPLARLGYTTPTPVQLKSIPIVLTGADLLAKAQTGTGKTAAFGLPMIDRLLVKGGAAGGTRKPRGLVLVPTRELALQVHKSLSTYGVPANLRVTAIFGGVSIVPQKKDLLRGTDIIVATPGRLLDHMEQRTVDLSAIEILCLDEADRMLDMGFMPPLRRILKVLPRDRQTLLFSATISEEVARLAADFTRNPQRVDVSEGQTMASTVTHRVHPVTDQRKGDLLTHVLKESPGAQALVFCKTKHGSNRVGQYLERAGINAAVIHGNKSQGARTKALADFKAGRVTVLVATDIAARGLDIAQLPLVVNFDLPLVAEDYIHRAGRTGRAGLEGKAISLVSPADRDLLRGIQRLLPTPIEHVTIEGFTHTAGSSDALPEAGRRHQGSRNNRGGFGGHRSGPRPSRPGGSGRRNSSSRRSFARG